MLRSWRRYTEFQQLGGVELCFEFIVVCIAVFNLVAVNMGTSTSYVITCYFAGFDWKYFCQQNLMTGNGMVLLLADG